MQTEKFFNRNYYLELIEKRIRDFKDGYRQNIAMLGDELVGKTAILHKFLSRFYDHQIIIIYTELRPEPLDSFARRFIGVLLYNFLLNSGISLEEDVDFLMRKSTRYIPETVHQAQLILDVLKRKKRSAVFAGLLGLSDTIAAETGKRCVVIFDEFHHLENTGIKDLYSEWSKAIVSQRHTMYIITSSAKFKARAVLSKNLSLLFGNFELLIVEPFDTSTSDEYLKLQLKEGNLSKGLRNFIVHFSGGCPFYLKVISEHLLKTKEINLANILEDLLFESSGILNQRFANYIKRFLDLPNSQDYISILCLTARGQNKIRDLGHILRKSQKEINSQINYLVESDIITRSGDFLCVNDRVFGFWLKFVYQEKVSSLTFDAQNQKGLFMANLEAMINEFLFNAQRSVSERTAELLRLFTDETVLMQTRRLRLSRFREIKSLELKAKNLKEGLLGRSHDSLWLLGFQRDVLTEDDVIEFIKECRKYRHKLQRKIIVAFNGIEANARLRALQEKIWVWDLNNLNKLCDLFSKPRIIV